MRLRLFWAAKMSQLFDSVRRHILVLPFFHFLYRSPRCLDDLPYPTGLITGIYSHRKKEERKKGLPLGKKTKVSYWFRKLISLCVSCLLFHTISTYACWIVCNYRQEARRLTITAQSLSSVSIGLVQLSRPFLDGVGGQRSWRTKGAIKGLRHTFESLFPSFEALHELCSSNASSLVRLTTETNC